MAPAEEAAAPPAESLRDRFESAGAEMEATIREELNAEMEAVKASCAAAIDRLQVRVEAIEG